jgi:hypothetical protein
VLSTVVDEVRDRYQFLADVAELGQEQRYLSHIESEIASKLRAMHALDPRRTELVRGHQFPLQQRYPNIRSRLLGTDPLTLR